MSSTLIIAVVALGVFTLAAVLVTGFVENRTRRVAERNRPPLTYYEAIRPKQKERMEPGVEYCWVSFEGAYPAESRRTVITYYDRETERQEIIPDPQGLESRNVEQRLQTDGWRLMMRSGHQEGTERQFERTKPGP